MPGDLRDVTQRFLADNSDYIRKIQEMKAEYASLVDMSRVTIKIDADNSDALTKIAAVKAELAALPDSKTIKIDVDTSGLDDLRKALGAAGGGDSEITRHLQDISTYMDMATDSMQRMENHMVVIGKNTGDSSAALLAQTQVLRDNADAHTAAATAAAAYAAASRGGGGRAVIPVPVGGGAGGGGAGGGFAAGTAGALWGNTIAPFLGTWLPRLHYAMMGINEALAVLGPAVIAAGSAALVGYQGGQNLASRYQAINQTAEALGGALGGQTTGSLIGVGSALQRAQNQATGQVYELAGAGINILKSGTGGAVLQMGSDTINMVDRAAANLTNYLTNKAVQNQLQGIIAGGVGYLQEIGQIGANVGKTFFNVAPSLPGVGGDYLAALKGLTGAAAWTTGKLGPALGPILAAEAAGRLGPALVGGVGAGIGRAGEALAGFGLDTSFGLAAGAGVGLESLGAAIGGLTAPELALGGAAAYEIGKGLTYQTPAQQQAAKTWAQIRAAGLTSALPVMIPAMNAAQLASAPAAGPPGLNQTGWGPFGANFFSGAQNYGKGFWDFTQGLGHLNFSEAQRGLVGIAHGFLQMIGLKGADEQASQTNAEATQRMVAAYNNMLDMGPKLVSTLQGVTGAKGLGAGNMAVAYALAQQAGVKMGDKWDAQTAAMVRNYVAGYIPMTGSGGAAWNTINAMYAAQGLSKVQPINQNWDAMIQAVQGGPSGLAALASLINAAPGTVAAAAGAPGRPSAAQMASVAKALTSFTSPAGSAAWTAFASTSQPSIISAAQQQMDWLRTAMTMGSLGGGTALRMGATELQSLLPYGAKSPAALATIGGLAQEVGLQGYDPTKSFAQNWKMISSEIKDAALNQKQFNQGMNQGTVNMASMSKDAQHFVTTMNADSLDQAAAAAAQVKNKFMTSLSGGKIDSSSLGNWVKDMYHQGISGANIKGIVDNALSNAGVGGALKKKIDLQVGADLSGLNKAKSALDGVKGKNVTIGAHDEASGKAKQASAAMNAIHDVSRLIHVVTNALSISGLAKGAMADVHDVEKAIHVVTNALSISSLAQGAMADVHDVEKAIHVVTNALSASSLAQSAMNAVHDVTRFITVVVRQVGSAVGGFLHSVGLQTGGLVPGSGSGDIIPAMLEPGEAVIPRYLVPALQGFLTAHRIPGFGAPIGSSSHFAAGGLVSGIPAGYLDVGGSVVPDSIAKLLDQLLAEVARSGIGKQFAVTLAGNVAASLRNMPGATASIAQALVSKITQETGLAKNVASAAMGGQGYASNQTLGSGIFGSMDMTSGQSAVQQTQTYLQTVQSFTKDLAAARKQGLNKDIIAQLVAAGPTQGDAVLQSILGISSGSRWGMYGGSGVKQENKLWAQLGGATNALGAQAAMAQYGGFLAPNLKSGSFSSNNITINISAGGGGGTLTLSDAQIKALVAEIQAALLKQAKKNRRTGLQLSGYGS